MCGRYTLAKAAKDLATEFEVPEVPLDGPRYNISTTQFTPVVRIDADGARQAASLKWGLIPSWADDPGIGSRMINARCETVQEKPAFRSAFKKRRGLILADGFFEWLASGKKTKVPQHFRLAEGGAFAFAGLWERWEGGKGKESDPIESFTLITTDPNELVKPVHDRMPVMLHPEDHALWLDPKAKPLDLAALLVPFPAEMMTGYAVGSLVSNPKNDRAECVEPA